MSSSEKDEVALKPSPAAGTPPAFRSRADSSPSRIIEAVRTGLMAGRYVPGQKLIETELTGQYRASRGTVREALKQLAAEGVVELTPHRGASITMLTRQQAYDLWQIWEALTALMVQLAADAVAQNNNKEMIREASRHLSSFQDSEYDAMSFPELRVEFYSSLISIGGNLQLPLVMPLIKVHILRMQIRPFLSHEQRRSVIAEYSRIANAVLAGLRREAQQEMTLHMRRTEERIRELPDEAFARPA